MKNLYLYAAFYLLIILFTIPCYCTAQQSSSLSILKEYALANKEKLGISQEDVESLFVTYEYTDAATGIQHIYSTQKLKGLTVTSTNFSLHVLNQVKTDASRLSALTSYKVLSVQNSINAEAAVLQLMNAIGYTADKHIEIKQPASGTERFTVFKRNNSSVWDIPCRLVYYNNTRLKSLTPAWEVQMMDVSKRHYWLGYIDAVTGIVLEKKDLIIHCSFKSGGITDNNLPGKEASHVTITNSRQTIEGVESQQGAQSLPNNKYRVYNIPFESPIDPGAAHSLVTKGGDVLASPDGWHKTGGLITYNYTHGNNVWAFQDPSPGPLGGVPSADPTRTAYPTNTILGIPPVNEPFVFDYPVNLTKDPTDYMYGAIVNLFFWNNLMHDAFYYMGFDEAAGNFQESNIFSSGMKGSLTSLGNDEVFAQAQDGGGTNNANFLALPDGINGQMQMYLWTASFPDSLVQVSSSTTGTPMSGTKYLAVQGSLNTLPIANNNLYTTPVVNKEIAIAQKNALSTVGSETEGCSTNQQSIALPLGNVSGKIALIDRGTCSFVEKVLGAQLGGAAGAIIVNNVDGPPQAMGGGDVTGDAVTIPSVMISKANGDILKAQLNAGAKIIGSLKRNTPPAPNRDGDIDNGVISHEYGHGISNRLTGGPLALLPLGGEEQGGEGWSDFIALYMTLRKNDLLPATTDHPNGLLPQRSIGNYVTYQNYDGQGIREYPYSTNLTVNPATFGYVMRPDYSETHSVGFVWCTMLYEVLQYFIDEYGMNDNVYEGANPTASHNPPASAKGNNIATRLIIEAMKLQPANPTFVDERDAILKADTLLYNAQHSCMIWKAFAKRGLGYSAKSGSYNLGDEVESFDVPFACDASQKRVRIVKSGPVTIKNNANIKYTIKVTNVFPTAITGLKVTDTLASSLTLVSATGNPVINGKIITWTTNVAANVTKTFTVTAKVNSATASMAIYANNQEGSDARWIVTGATGTKWNYKNDAANAYSGSNYWFAPDSSISANTTLRTKGLIQIPTGAELVFAHKFSTEMGYDGGVVEISSNGSTWNYLPPSKFVQGNYTGIITTAHNSNIGTADEAAFTGTTGGYITSIAKLDDYAGRRVYIRFRMTTDSANNISGGGWWVDDVYILTNTTQLTNTATAIALQGAPISNTEGTNAYSATTAFVVASANALLTATPKQQAVLLQWQVANEEGSPVFDIQRKAPGDNDFVTIDTYTPSATEKSAGRYTYTDNHAVSGNRQYRIKQVSTSSSLYATNIASVNKSTRLQAVLYPNPVKDIANINITNNSKENAYIHIFNINGKKLATLNAGNISKTIALPVQQLVNSTYWVEVSTGSESVTIPLVIER